MKIALVGNMNNNFFSILRHLIDRGYTANLFYSYNQEHFTPKADTKSLHHLLFCKEVDWGEELSESTKKAILSDLEGFDFYIGQGNEAALAKFAGINFDIYYPYGSDVYKYAYLKPEYTILAQIYLRFRRKIPMKTIKAGTIHKYTKSAISNADNVFFDYSNEEMESKILGLSLKGSFRNIPMPFIYHKEYDKQDKDVHWGEEIDRIREANDFLILHHGRLEWKKGLYYSNNSFTCKNSHHLIIGFSRFLEQTPGIKTKLLLIEYGGDVRNSKDLVKQLDIEKHVIWLPKMFRKDIMYVIKNVDLCCGEFDKSYLTFGTIIEAMIMGKPVIHHRVDQLYSSYPELYPLYNGREVDEIERCLNDAATNIEKREKMGHDARKWVLKYFIEEPLNELVSVIENKRRDGGLAVMKTQ